MPHRQYISWTISGNNGILFKHFLEASTTQAHGLCPLLTFSFLLCFFCFTTDSRHSSRDSPMVDNYQPSSPSNQKCWLIILSWGSVIGQTPQFLPLIGWLTQTVLVKCSAPTQQWLNHSMNNNRPQQQPTDKNFWWHYFLNCSVPPSTFICKFDFWFFQLEQTQLSSS